VGRDEVMAANRRECLRASIKRQRGPRGATEQHVVMLAGAVDQFDNVAAELVVHADAPNDLLAVDNLVGLDHVLDFVDRVFELEPAQHRRFLLSRRVAEIEPDQEPVELCFGQGEGPLMVHKAASTSMISWRLPIITLSILAMILLLVALTSAMS